MDAVARLFPGPGNRRTAVRRLPAARDGVPGGSLGLPLEQGTQPRALGARVAERGAIVRDHRAL